MVRQQIKAMDAATLCIVINLNGSEREYRPAQFPSVQACETYVTNLRKRLNDLPFPASVQRYECMRWYRLGESSRDAALSAPSIDKP